MNLELCSVETRDYNVDLHGLLRRRLERTGTDFDILEGNSEYVCVDTGTQGRFEAFTDAMTELILYDLSQYEIARMVKRLPFDDDEKRMVLEEALAYAKTSTLRTTVKREITKHFEEHIHMVAEGFIRFRIKDTVRIWERCIDKAAEELMIRGERDELMDILGAFVSICPSKIREVSLILNRDGSAILTDDSDTRVKYEPEARDCLVSILVSLSPERIVVYDLSDGQCDEFLDSIVQVFAKRVRIYCATYE